MGFWFLWMGLIPAHGDIRFDVFVGYDGIVPVSSWYPVVCEVLNDGPGFDAVFEVSGAYYNQDDRRRLALELPTGTLKRFVIPMPASSVYSSRMEARLLDRRGRVRAENPSIPIRRQNDWRVPLVGGLTRTVPVFPEIQSQRSMRPLVARLLPQVFPENPIALEGLDTIYLSSERALALREGQAEALRIWLYGGGHLVLGVEHRTDLQGAAWLEKLLPGAVTGSHTVTDHSALEVWLRSDRDLEGRELEPGLQVGSRQGNRKPAGFTNPYASLEEDTEFKQQPLQAVTVEVGEGTIQVGTATTPLVVGATRGLGRLTMLTFSPELEPFLSWTNRPYFWAKVCGVPPELLQKERVNRSYNYNRQSIDGVIGAMIETRQVRKLPVGWLLVLLVGYLVVIGPLDRIWLKKINRQMLTWLTFPVYVVFFSLLIYFIGYKLRAGETEWNELHVVDVVGKDRAVDLYGLTYGAIYSPANARYEFSSGESFAALRSEFGSSEGGRSQFEQRGNSFLARVAVPVWTSRLLACDWWRPDRAPVLTSLERQGSKRVLRVESRLDQGCQMLQFVLEGKIYDLGGLAAGATRVVDLEESAALSLSEFVAAQSADFQKIVRARRQAFGRAGWTQVGSVPQMAMAASFISQSDRFPCLTPPRLDLSRAVERGDGILLAWMEAYAPTMELNQFKPRRGRRDTLWRLHVTSQPSSKN